MSYFKYTQHDKFMIGLGSYFNQKTTTSDCVAYHLEFILHVIKFICNDVFLDS
jgi:hypothetical protein